MSKKLMSWEEEAAKSPRCAQAVDMLKEIAEKGGPPLVYGITRANWGETANLLSLLRRIRANDRSVGYDESLCRSFCR